MTDLPFLSPLVKTAQRIRGTRVELAHSEPPAKDSWVRDLHDAGYVRVHFTAAFKRSPDYWKLTDAGKQWLCDAEAAAMWSHTGGVNP